MTLTKKQIDEYYKTQSSSKTPLSPVDYERSLTPLGGNRSLDDTTTAPERNLQTQGSPLTDFAETLSKATDLARKKRNKMSMELLGERFDMSAEPASGFAGILADINRASKKFESEQLEDISGTGKLTSEKVGGFEVLRDAMGNIISTRTLKSDTLKVPDDKNLDKPLSPNELRTIRDDYGISTEDLPVGSTMRDAQIAQAEKFAEDNKDEDPEEVRNAIIENTNLMEAEAISIWEKIRRKIAVPVYDFFGGDKETEKPEEKTKDKELEDLLNSF